MSTADRVTPLYVAEMVAVPDPEELSATLNAPVELFAGTVTLGGTVARAVLALVSVTKAPPDGVNAVKEIVAEVWTVPVCTVEGLRMIESNAAPDGGGGGGGGVVTVHPDSRTLTAVAEPSFTSTVQSAGRVYPDRSTRKLPVLLLVVICTPSTVIGRPAVA
ncbi:MAG: hypothetical protein ABIS21_06860 [Acidimicrobiales bacterium]